MPTKRKFLTLLERVKIIELNILNEYNFPILNAHIYDNCQNIYCFS